MLPAVCCIGYNRPNSMRRLLNSVGNAVYDDNDITLIVSIDESDKSDEVETVAREFEWKYGNKEIIRYPQRLGLKEHCLRCGDLSLKYGAVIFLEDDVVVAPGYYRYTKAAVEKYKDYDDVFCISLYYDNWFPSLSLEFKPAYNGYDTFFAIFEESHGQCWMSKGWSEFRMWLNEHPTANWYNKGISPFVYQWNPSTSWSRFVTFYIVEKQKYYVLPYHSYATNMSDVGVHTSLMNDISQTALSLSVESNFKFPDFNNAIIYDSFAERIDNFVDKVDNVELSKICIDLNGTKYDWSGFDYIITTKKLPYQSLKQFGINMEPIENNIVYNVPGDAITLYKIPENYKPQKDVLSVLQYTTSNKRLMHAYGKVPLKLLLYVVYNKLLRKVCLFFKS